MLKEGNHSGFAGRALKPIGLARAGRFRQSHPVTGINGLPVRLFSTLKFQIASALLLIVALFVAIFSLSLSVLEEQRSYSALFSITARLEQTAQRLVTFGMHYAMSPPQQAPSERELQLYYVEIRSQIELFDEITNGFMHESFSPSLTNRNTDFTPTLDPAVHIAVRAVEESWASFRQGVLTALGDPPSAAGLGQTVKFINTQNTPVNESIRVLRSQIQRLIDSRLAHINQVYWGMLIAIIVITLGMLAWFLRAVLRPLDRAVKGFRKVAQGDFGAQVPVAANNEIAWITDAFNQLSSRLHAIFLLIDRIQQGSDLDDTLCFVAEEFPSLLPLDWVGALFVAGDDGTINLERSYRNGKPEIAVRSRFRLQGTLLQQALQRDQPLHIPDMLSTAANNAQFQFLNHLTEKGLRDAIFLPITGQSPIPGVLAFATRKAGSYSAEHLELLTNIGRLVTHSFGRTVRLAEHARLAAIGGFASSIAHEIRSPLSTISMALDYLQKVQLPGPAEKRTLLAQNEAARIARLLEEILLYAKPLQLRMQTLDLARALPAFLDSHSALPARRGQTFELLLKIPQGRIMADSDRLQQILLNLANNACEAAPEGAVIKWELSGDAARRTLTLSVHNPGEPIPPAVLGQLFEPFFTTKSDGTGLGLGIVKRMVEAHGGDIHIRSNTSEGTVAVLQIPLAWETGANDASADAEKKRPPVDRGLR